VYNPDYLITFVVMFATSITCSVLTKRVKNYAAENARKSYRSELLLQASRSLQEASTSQEILQKQVNSWESFWKKEYTVLWENRKLENAERTVKRG
jgi:Osmosensitive K+ channel histidine kinase